MRRKTVWMRREDPSPLHPRTFAVAYSRFGSHNLILHRWGKVKLAPSVHCKKSEYLATRHPHSFIHVDAEINLHVDLRCFFSVFHNGFRKKYVLYVINYFRKVPQCPKFKINFSLWFQSSEPIESKQLTNILLQSRTRHIKALHALLILLYSFRQTHNGTKMLSKMDI